eukprot:GHVO01063836.1.p1 GENE.GHVO01063836.1~~GHVO01063836.1.p1  ORF type:complete len:1053 (-),score=201.67 GHVO01063836.1:217-3375(-)
MSAQRHLPAFVTRAVQAVWNGGTASGAVEIQSKEVKGKLKHFDTDEIETIRKIYKELAGRSSHQCIDRDTFCQFFSLPVLWARRLFKFFDQKSDTVIDYEEFILGLAVCCRGTKGEKTKVLFQMFDLNGDGYIQRDELITMLSNIPDLNDLVPVRVKRILAEKSDSPATKSENLSRLNGVEMGGSTSDRVQVRHIDTIFESEGRGSDEENDFYDSEDSDDDSVENVQDESKAFDDSDGHIRACQTANGLLDKEKIKGTEDDINVEDLVESIFEECEFSTEPGLSLVEFRGWLDTFDFVLDIFKWCFHEEVWGLEGNALYREAQLCVPNQTSKLGGTTHAGKAAVHITPDQAFKIRRLFVKQHRDFLVVNRGKVKTTAPLSTPPSEIKRTPATITPEAQSEVTLGLVTLMGMANHNADKPRPASSPQEERRIEELLACPFCDVPLLICPDCYSGPLKLKVTSEEVLLECETESCPRYIQACWQCDKDFMHTVAMVDKNAPTYEGYLRKRGKYLSGRKSRYYILIDNVVYYYAKKSAMKPRGILFLEGCSVEKHHATALPYGICVTHNGEKPTKRLLYANSENERSYWIDALRAAVKQQGGENTYKIQDQIGRGKFSLVYRAISERSGMEYAVKVIDKNQITKQERNMLLSEMGILKLLHHPHVIRLKETLDTCDTLYIVMDLIRGGELFDLLQEKKRLDETQCNRIIHQLLSTLTYIHKCGIVHRDLKPENILLTDRSPEADIKITDFGLSCVCGPSESLSQPCGTLAYVAPEVLALTGYSHKADVWSVGVIMYLLLRGRLPIPPSATESLFRIYKASLTPDAPRTQHGQFKNPLFSEQLGHTPPLVSLQGAHWDNISSSAKDLLRRMLHPNPDFRISSNDALNHKWVTNLTAVMSDGPVQSSTASEGLFSSSWKLPVPYSIRYRDRSERSRCKKCDKGGRGRRCTCHEADGVGAIDGLDDVSMSTFTVPRHLLNKSSDPAVRSKGNKECPKNKRGKNREDEWAIGAHRHPNHYFPRETGVHTMRPRRNSNRKSSGGMGWRNVLDSNHPAFRD